MKMLKKCAKSLLREFQLRKFGFNYNRLEHFYQSQWQRTHRSIIYLIYRWFVALCCICVFLACLSLQFSAGKFFIFLTNWGLTLCLATQVIAAILVTYWHFDIGGVRGREIEPGSSIKRWSDDDYADEPPEPKHNTPLLIKFYWMLHGITLTLALVITTVYWTFLHGKMNKPMRYPAISFITHCLNSIFMLVDFAIVGYPLRLLHTVYWMACPIFYCFFTVVYFWCGGTDEYNNHYVYPIMDWTTPVRGIVTFAGVFVLYVIYTLILFALFKLKCCLSHKLSERKRNRFNVEIIE